MHKPAGYLSKQSKRRIANAKNYLRRLLSAGKYDQAREYALAQGLTLEPWAEPPTGGEGVGSTVTTGNINSIAPLEQNSTKSLTSRTVGATYVYTDTPQAVPGDLQDTEGNAGRSASVKASSAPMLKISSKGVVHEQLGKLWYAFAQRVRQARAHSVMSWQEWEALEGELGAVGKVAWERDAVVTERGVANVNNPELEHASDPVGTIKAVVWKEVPNRSMRVVRLAVPYPSPFRAMSIEEAVCWVPRGKVPAIGQEIFMCPNEDERGGYVMVGEYGKNGGRVR